MRPVLFDRSGFAGSGRAGFRRSPAFPADFPGHARKRTAPGKSREPDLYSLGRPGEELVLFELEIPDDRLVLTEYNTWHYVLNKWFYCRVKDGEDFRNRNDWFDALPPEEKEKVMERSWQAVFDTKLRDNGEWDRNGQFVQATFWELRAGDIVSCRRCVVPEEEEEE